MEKWVLLIQPRNILPWQFLFSIHFLKCYHLRKHDCVQSPRKWPKNRHNFKFSCLIHFNTINIQRIKWWKVVGIGFISLLIKVVIFSLKSPWVPTFFFEIKNKIKNLGIFLPLIRLTVRCAIIELLFYLKVSKIVQNQCFILSIWQEKMYEFEQNKKNNIILHGVTTKHPETSESLRTRIVNIFRDNLNIRRDVPVTRASRIHTGPDVRGCRPVLVTFETFKGWYHFHSLTPKFKHSSVSEICNGGKNSKQWS